MSDKKDLDELLKKYVDQDKVKKDLEKLEHERNKPIFTIKELRKKHMERKGYK